ncbi:MAG: peptidoglycan-associated lipoprotein Pal [Nitrospiraceae bacterium]
MNRRSYDRISVMTLGLCGLVAMGGCSKSVQVATQDQAMVPGQKVEKQAAAPTVAEPKEEVRVAEQPAEKAAEQPAAAAPASVSSLTDLADVFFDFDKFSIRTDASPILDANARLLKGGNGWKLVIAGHCDERGTSAYNLVLGERRAQAAKKYLADLGVSVSQIQVTSYGKEKPFCTEHNQECWQKNRRAHFSAQ